MGARMVKTEKNEGKKKPLIIVYGPKPPQKPYKQVLIKLVTIQELESDVSP